MLRAYTLLERGVHYLVSEGRIVLIDQDTGRPLPDSRYRFGIHAALEAKEGLRVRDEPRTLAQISVRGFVGRYERVAGMTGTAQDAESEFGSEYGLRVVVVPPSNPERRADLAPRVYASRDDKLAAVAEEAAFWHGVGRPVLIGAATIDQSERVSRLLAARGVPHALLNAISRQDEAGVIRARGQLRSRHRRHQHGRARRGHRIGAARGRARNSRLRRHARPYAGRRRGPRIRAMRQPPGRRNAGRRPSPVGATLVVARRRMAHHGDATITLGDPESPATHVEFGLGLYVIGAELNPSARTDRQLRGRSGRQGASGASRFILSREDELLAFGGGNDIGEGAGAERRLSEIQGRARTRRRGASGRAA